MKTTITRVGYFNGKFLYSPTGWPEKLEAGCNGKPYCCPGERCRWLVEVENYQQSLSSDIVQAVEFEDQERISMIVSDYAIFNHRLFDKDSEGVYTIPPTEIEIVEIPAYVHKASDFDSIIQGASFKRVARLVTQQSEPSPVEEKKNDMTLRQKIRDLIFKYWRFDNDQRHLSNWHDRNDLSEEIDKVNWEQFQSPAVEETQEELTRHQITEEWGNHDEHGILDWLLENFRITRKK